MSLGRFSVMLSAVVFGSFGCAFLLFPVRMASIVGIELPTPSASIDLRATYGGLEVGLAVFFALCAVRESWVRCGLVAQAAALGGLACSRLIGLAVDGKPQPVIYYLLAAEIAGCVLALLAMWIEAKRSRKLRDAR